MIADPALPNKILEDRQEDIIPCMACNLCLARLFRDQPITCLVRPNVGYEGHPDWQVKPADKKKRVHVVGGGPSGMMAAIVAAIPIAARDTGRPVIVVGGLAVLCRLSTPYRGTTGLDTVSRLQAGQVG